MTSVVLCSTAVVITHVLPAFLLREFDPLFLAMSSLTNRKHQNCYLIFISFIRISFYFNDANLANLYAHSALFSGFLSRNPFIANHYDIWARIGNNTNCFLVYMISIDEKSRKIARHNKEEKI